MASTPPARPRSGLGSSRRRTPGTSGRHPSSGTASVGSAGATDPVTDTLLAAPPRSPYDRYLISAKPVRMLKLIPNDPPGRVDGFDDDEAEGESHEGSEVLARFLATERDALEALELADQLLDAGAGAVERLRKESGPVSGRGLERDHRADAPFARGRAIARAVVSFVPHRSPRRDVRPEVKQDLELRTVARLTLCEVESQRQAIEIGLEMDLGREAPAGAAQRLAILPPFGPCRRDVGA